MQQSTPSIMFFSFHKTFFFRIKTIFVVAWYPFRNLPMDPHSQAKLHAVYLCTVWGGDILLILSVNPTSQMPVPHWFLNLTLHHEPISLHLPLPLLVQVIHTWFMFKKKHYCSHNRKALMYYPTKPNSWSCVRSEKKTTNFTVLPIHQVRSTHEIVTE